MTTSVSDTIETISSAERFAQRLADLEEKRLVRVYREVDRSIGEPPMARVDGRDCLMFCTNDYLQLAQHPVVGEAMTRAVAEYGAGTGGSRYIGGTTPLHHRLEERLADFHGREAVAFFVTGYMANQGSISALAQAGDVIFSDADNHASIIDGCRMSRAQKVVWNHNDAEHLDHLLRVTPASGLRLVACESLYSMSGDFAPLEAILDVTQRHGACLYLDEVHALGGYGPGGRGYAASLGLSDQVDILMAGTAKAVGVLGGYIAADHEVVQLLKSTARAFIFTISLPTPLVAGILAALDLVEQGEHLRQRMHAMAGFLRRLLQENDFCFLDSRSHIVPVMVGPPERTIHAFADLLDQGFYAQGIIAPSVPYNAGRLRVTVTPAHTEEHVARFIAALKRTRDRVGGFHHA